MSIKRILVPLPDSVDHAGETEHGIVRRQGIGGHVEALYISAAAAAATRSHGGRRVRLRRKDCRRATIGLVSPRSASGWRARRASVSRMPAPPASIPFIAANEEPGALPAASWREAEGSYVDIAVARAAAFDLMVAASAAVMESLKDIAEQSLLRTRRPVLLAPSRLNGRFDRTPR